MGLLRLLLAIAVLLSHMGYTVYGYNPGVAAVVVFYILAGQVVARLWFKAPAEQRLWWFLRDRALRILPAYYVSLVLVAGVWWLGWLHDPYFLGHEPTSFDWFANISLLPMNYFMFNGSDRFALLPTAWSLALEVQFYLLVPLLLSRVWLYRSIALLSLLVFAGAQVELIQHEHYGYRLLPGVLWVFLSGVLLAQPSRRHYGVLAILWALCCVYTTSLFVSNNTLSFLFEVAFGYSMGLPMVYLLGRISVRSPFMQVLQRHSGAYSYPLFLIHLPIIWWFNAVLGPSSWAWAWVLIASLIYAMLMHNLIELRLWRRLRPTLKL